MNALTKAAQRTGGILSVLLLTATVAHADPDDHWLRRGVAHQHFDDRYNHNHYYFDQGYTVRVAPRNGVAVRRGPDRFWFDRGQWYRPGPRGWIVIGAPFGALVPVLPPYYTTVWVAGLPYYYANDTYYRWHGDLHEYEVVQPPEADGQVGTTAAPASDQVFSYPRNGQSTEQQADDRYTCHRAAVDQTHYDPTVSGGGVPGEVTASKRSDYFRAEAACLDARGYSVR